MNTKRPNRNNLTILQRQDYDPYGMSYKKNLNTNLEHKYQFNGIDYVGDFGLDWSMARYRSLDASVGVWGGVDPKAEHDYAGSPYNSMYNNPISYNDPLGDCPNCILGGIGAAIGAVGNVIYQGVQGNINSLGDLGMAALIGGGAGFVTGFTGGAASGAFGTATLGASIGSGAVAGAAGGAAGGLIQGTGNAMYFGDQNFGDALSGAGLQGALYGGIGGAVTGAIGGAIAYKSPTGTTGPPNKAVGPEDPVIKASIKTGNPIAQLPDGTLMQQLNNGSWVKYNPGAVSNTGAQAGLPNGVGGLNLFKFGSPQATTSSGWRLGDRFLNLPNRGTPQLNWKQNAGFLRQEMRLGNPIFDSYRMGNGNLIQTGGFLNAERFLLQSRGWIYSPIRGAWLPPGF